MKIKEKIKCIKSRFNSFDKKKFPEDLLWLLVRLTESIDILEYYSNPDNYKDSLNILRDSGKRAVKFLESTHNEL